MKRGGAGRGAGRGAKEAKRTCQVSARFQVEPPILIASSGRARRNGILGRTNPFPLAPVLRPETRTVTTKTSETIVCGQSTSHRRQRRFALHLLSHSTNTSKQIAYHLLN